MDILISEDLQHPALDRLARKFPTTWDAKLWKEPERLKAEIARVPSDLRGRFDVRYRAWKYSWRRKPILFNTKTARGTAEFRALVALGPGILPLLVDRLVRRDEYAALQAYDALQDRPDLRLDPQDYPSEQQRALETARRWLART